MQIQRKRKFDGRLKGSQDVKLHKVDTQKALTSQATRMQSVKLPEQRECLLNEKEIADLRKSLSGYYSGGIMKLKREYTYIKTKIRFALLKLKK